MIYKRNPRTAWRFYEDTVLIVTPDDSKLHKLNETASFVWKILENGPIGLEKIVEMVYNEFEAPHETVVADVEQFLKNGCEMGILLSEPML